ncbi:MAG: photosynthetic complex assembly protein PuhC [Pseudomonadota bacterium]
MATTTLQRDREKVPRVLLRAIALLLVITLGMVTWARLTGQPPAAMPPDESQIIAERKIQLIGEKNGATRVLDADGSLIADLGPNEAGFVSAVTRSLKLKRRLAGVDETLPIRLVRFSDGHLAVRDDLTGWRAELLGFGKDNAAAFERLFTN